MSSGLESLEPRVPIVIDKEDLREEVDALFELTDAGANAVLEAELARVRETPKTEPVGEVYSSVAYPLERGGVFVTSQPLESLPASLTSQFKGIAKAPETGPEETPQEILQPTTLGDVFDTVMALHTVQEMRKRAKEQRDRAGQYAGAMAAVALMWMVSHVGGLETNQKTGKSETE